MLLSVIQFELRYRLRRPATWIYFALLGFLGFSALYWDAVQIGGAAGQIKQNSPVVLFQIMGLITAALGVFITSAIMGVPVLRDYEHKTEALMFTSRLRKSDYLFGRFIGSFLTLLLVYVSLPLGMMLAMITPGLEADKYLPLIAWHYWQPFFCLVMPNLLFSGALFFAVGSLTRKMMYVYVQGIALCALYIMALGMTSDVDKQSSAALMDAFGVVTGNVLTRYWTVAEQNSQTVPMAGVFLLNRLLWMSVGVIVLIFTYFRFSFNTAGTGKASKSRKTAKSEGKMPAVAAALAKLSQPLQPQAFRQVWALARVYFLEVVRSIPFIAIALIGIVIVIINMQGANMMYGTRIYPQTSIIVEQVSGSFSLFSFIIIIFFSGELIWRERDLRMNQIFDALPMAGFVPLAAKLLAFVLILAVLQTGIFFAGIATQTIQGYFRYEPMIYIKSLYGKEMLGLLQYVLLAMFLQTIVNNKFVGYAVMVLFLIVSEFMGDLGLEHSMFEFGSGSLGSYSDMNTFGHFGIKWGWMKGYWLTLGGILFGLSVLLIVRGTDTALKTRLRLAQQRFARPTIIFLGSMLVLFVASGSYIYYNTNVLHKYRSSKEGEKLQADYELTLRKYKDLPQPKIVESNLKIDIFPEGRDFTTEGYFILKNKTDKPIDKIHVWQGSDDEVFYDYLKFDREAGIVEKYEQFRYFVYGLKQPLAAGDSLTMRFKLRFQSDGFVEGSSNVEILQNGTFFNNTMFPTLGYSEDGEIADDDTRKEQKLPPRERMRPRNDPAGQRMTLLGDDADRIRLEVVLSTSPDQIAIAPGYLQREWTEGNRRYFHYKMDKPVLNFYNIVSARYVVKRDEWKPADGGQPVALEIYYHPGHAYNVDKMMVSMKKSFDYYHKAFGPYQYRQMRIMEFPRYRTFAQSFANTVPFSEGIGFILNVGEDDVDMSFYVTAHELAHQWWAHQLTEAGVQGNAMMSETLAQYSALMVMKHSFPPERIQKFLKYELDKYLQGRAGETKKEQPLALVERQPYIHYRKGSLVMYALQDYIGEDSVNAALRRVLRDWGSREDRYITSDELLKYYRAVTPDSMQYLITDMFETITLFENRVKSPTYAESGGKYRVSIPVSAIKYRADSLGRETAEPINDLIDIGVYAANSKGKDSLIYLQKHRIRQQESTIELTVSQKPTRAGIDPIHKLIDRNPDDNTAAVGERK